jgi:hypothetical protein
MSLEHRRDELGVEYAVRDHNNVTIFGQHVEARQFTPL